MEWSRSINERTETNTSKMKKKTNLKLDALLSVVVVVVVGWLVGWPVDWLAIKILLYHCWCSFCNDFLPRPLSLSLASIFLKVMSIDSVGMATTDDEN